MSRGRWFAWSLVAITAGGLALRIAYVLSSARIWSSPATRSSGTVMLRRRKAPLLPLMVAPLIVVAVTIAFSNPRYRASTETALVVLAAVAIDAGSGGSGAHRRRAAPPVLA